MGLMEKLLNGKKTEPAAELPVVVTPSPGLDGRDRLRFFSAQLAKAHKAITELEEREERLAAIIKDALAAHAALHQAIALDGGVALAEYSAGNASDNAPIAKLIAAEETTAKAAAAARDALPNVQAMLANARSQVGSIKQQREDEVLAYLQRRADDYALQYKKIFSALCRQHDVLCGISQAISTTGAYGGDIRMSTMPVEVPRFNLPSIAAFGNRVPGSTADPSEYLPMMTHIAADFTVQQSTKDWTQARERLAKDADADLDDLIGPPLDEVEHKL